MHATFGVTLGHLLMDDAAAGGHPLDVTGRERTDVAKAVAVVHGTGKHVGDRFDAAMRMPRETRHVVGRFLSPEVIEQQERIKIGRVAEAEGAMQLDAGPFKCGLGGNDAGDGTNRHS